MNYIKLKDNEEKKIDNIFDFNLVVSMHDDIYSVSCEGKTISGFDNIAIEQTEEDELMIKAINGREIKSYRLDILGDFEEVGTEYFRNIDYYNPDFYYLHLFKKGMKLIESNQEFVVFKTPKNHYFLVKFGDKAEDIKKYPKFKSYLELALFYNREYSIGYFNIKKHREEEFANLRKIHDVFAEKVAGSDDVLTAFAEKERKLNRSANLQTILNNFYDMEIKVIFLLKKALKDNLGNEIYEDKTKVKITPCKIVNKEQFLKCSISDMARRKRPTGYVTYRGILTGKDAVKEVASFLLHRIGARSTCFELPVYGEKLYVDWTNFNVFTVKDLKNNNLITYSSDSTFMKEYSDLVKQIMEQEKSIDDNRSSFDKMPISLLNISSESKQILSFSGVFCVGDLIQFSSHDLFVKGLNIKQVKEIELELAYWGAELKQNEFVVKNNGGQTV